MKPDFEERGQWLHQVLCTPCECGNDDGFAKSDCIECVTWLYGIARADGMEAATAHVAECNWSNSADERPCGYEQCLACKSRRSILAAAQEARGGD